MSELGPNMEGRIASAFDLGAPAGPLTPVERGAMGMVWRLDTERGAWAVKQLFEWARGEERLDLETRVTDAAVAAGVATPRIVRTPDGAVIATLDDQRWRVFSWMDLGPPTRRPLCAEQAEGIGSLLARLHRLNLSGDPAEIIGWFTGRRTAAQWRGLEAQAREASAPWAPLLAAALPGIEELVRTADPKNFSGACVISHCDLTEDNVRFGPSGAQLIDWEHAGHIPPAWELGSVLQLWATGPGDETVDVAAGQAIVEAYRVGGGWAGPLTLDIFAGSISAWLNWTVSRVYTALHGKDVAERERAATEASALLRHPVTADRLQRLVASLES
ncbi:MAG TPA: phosphotransferase [Caulobacteraceae bacterium]|jgi:Ser/Thr protein kinase RdoA (MazF antagonist)